MPVSLSTFLKLLEISFKNSKTNDKQNEWIRRKLMPLCGSALLRMGIFFAIQNHMATCRKKCMWTAKSSFTGFWMDSCIGFVLAPNLNRFCSHESGPRMYFAKVYFYVLDILMVLEVPYQIFIIKTSELEMLKQEIKFLSRNELLCFLLIHK